MTFYTEEELRELSPDDIRDLTNRSITENRQLYEAYRSDEVVIFPHFDCLARYINELEKYYAEHEDGSVVSDVEMYEKLRQLHQETPTNLFTVLARNGYTIPGTSVTCSTLFSTADPSIAWRWERPKFSDVAELWAPGSETAADSEITDVVKVMFRSHGCPKSHLTVVVFSGHQGPVGSNRVA